VYKIFWRPRGAEAVVVSFGSRGLVALSRSSACPLLIAAGQVTGSDEKPDFWSPEKM